MSPIVASPGSDHWQDHVPELDDSIRLLLLFSRVRLDDEQLARALSLAGRITDWTAFARRAAEHFLAPLCLHHLAAFGNTPSLVEARSALGQVVLPMAMKSLQLASMQRSFLRDFLLPFNVPFVVIKGRAMGTRYYPNAGLRYSRDLDILLPVERMPDVVLAAQARGYRVYPDNVEYSAGELQVLAGSGRVITLIGPERILIELHSQLDKVGFLLDHEAMLARRESIVIDGVRAGVLTTSDHLIYVCLHHSRHFWSRLNWLADLDGLIHSPSFDQTKVLARAAELGLERTVAACLLLHEACAAAEPWEVAQTSSDALDFLRACLLILEQGAEQEFVMRPDRASPDFSFAWQFTPGYEHKRLRQSRRLARLPSLDDYRALPLPTGWHWAYPWLRPVRLLLRRLSWRDQSNGHGNQQ